MKIEDGVLIERIKESNCEESLKELINRHSGLCYSVYSRYSNALSASGINFEDAVKEKDLVVYKSALSYKPNKKTKFSTWLGNYTRYHCLNLINEKKNYICVEDKDLHYHMDKNSGESGLNPQDLKEIKDYARNILSQLKDGRIKKVFELRYFSEDGKNTWNKISQKMNLSIQTVINLHSRGAKILKRKIYSSNFEDLV